MNIDQNEAANEALLIAIGQAAVEKKTVGLYHVLSRVASDMARWSLNRQFFEEDTHALARLTDAQDILDRKARLAKLRRERTALEKRFKQHGADFALVNPKA